VRRVRALIGLGVMALVLGSCTFVPTDSQPQVVNSKNVPFHLLDKKPPVDAGPLKSSPQ
jgi:hypothetical protein